MHADGHVPERFRALIYINAPDGEASQPLVTSLIGYLSSRHWVHVGTHFDAGGGTPAEDRSGLVAAVGRIKGGEAAALVMPAKHYEELPSMSRSWLEFEVQRYGGFISEVATDEPCDDLQDAREVRLHIWGRTAKDADEVAVYAGLHLERHALKAVETTRTISRTCPIPTNDQAAVAQDASYGRVWAAYPRDGS
jgi:hypothetical protein